MFSKGYNWEAVSVLTLTLYRQKIDHVAILLGGIMKPATMLSDDDEKEEKEYDGDEDDTFTTIAWWSETGRIESGPEEWMIGISCWFIVGLRLPEMQSSLNTFYMQLDA